MFRTGILAGVIALGATGAMAAVVDFENESPLNPDPTLIAVGNSYVNGGVTFTSTETMQLVGTGPNPTSAFVPNDTPGSSASGPASFGNVFLTGDFLGNTNMNMKFAVGLDNIAFDIVDIDGGNDSIVGDDQEEQFTFDFRFLGSSQFTQTITSRDLTGALNDAGVIRVSFFGAVDEVQIVGITPGGSRNIGWGIDNLETVGRTTFSSPAPVPLPAGAVLMLTALGGLGALRARKRRS